MRRISIAVLILNLMLGTTMLAGEPFASKVSTPENPENDPDLALAILFVENVKVPDKEEVGVAAYPEAKIFQTTAAQAEMLPSVRLLSGDEIAQVVEFYKKELEGWKYKDFYGVHMFYTGNEQDAMFGKIPVIQIEDAEKFKNISATAKSAITIMYNVKTN